MNLTKVKSAILLCILLVSIAYGFSVAISTAHATPNEPATCQDHLAAFDPGHYTPMGDPIESPKPNKK